VLELLKSLLRRILGEPAPKQAGRTQRPAPPAAKTTGPKPAQPAAPPRSRVPNRPAAPKPTAKRPQAPKPRPPRHVPTEQHSTRTIAYAPDLDGDADPGEIVWTWVPYEEDPNQGKDRPVLVVGREGNTLLGLMLSSQSDRDGQRNWFALGPGEWDRTQRPSWIRLDRVLEVEEDGIRREGAILDRGRFSQVAAELQRGYGWA
jgi:hypothetical protein